MNTIEPTDLPLYTLIKNLSNTKGSPITFEELTNELNKKSDDNTPIYFINMKTNDDLAILYYDNLPSSDTSRNQLAVDIEQTTRSIIIEKESLKPIASQFNKIIFNEDALKYISNSNWSNIVIQPCYEGTLLLVFNHNDKWYISTRRCLNAENSNWIKNLSYNKMFFDAMNNKFKLEDLNKDYCYHFVLVHYKNKNIVNYSNLKPYYKELYQVMTTEKYTLNEVEATVPNIMKVESKNFNDIDELLNKLSQISEEDTKSFNISTEGYVLKVYHGEKYKSQFTVLKLQTEIYQS
jgi:hypothetical protein